jgi:hypothetical protein
MLELLAEYDKTQGMTIKAFCKLHKVTEGSFYTARKRYRSAAISKQQSSRFIPIGRTAFNESAAILFAEVNGIKLYQAVPADYLKSLIA